jgi:glycerol-3-phosphate dehydrogenase subunit B
MLDLLVIGAGLSGLTTALAAAEAGLSVRIVAKGLGALHWSAGTIDVLGYLPDDSIAVANPFASMAKLPERHPYRILGAQSVADALRRFQSLMGAAGLAYHAAPDFDWNQHLPTAVGAVRPTFMAPTAQHKGDTEQSAPMLIVGVEGMRDFYPMLVAENLARQGMSVRAAFVPWAAVAEQGDRNNIQIASTLDDPPQRRKLAQALKALVRPGERIGMPAILGMAEHAAVMAELETATGATLFEIPALPPSVPGARLHAALRNRLRTLGVRIESNMEAIGFGSEESSAGARIAWVETETSARPLRHAARAYVLATGGVLGGGFSSDLTGRFWERIFDLPLTVPQDRRAWFRPRFLDAAGQPVFQGGVVVDEHLQPLDGTGARVYTNLWAVGGALDEADPVRERSLEGIAVATGIAAAAQVAVALAQAPVHA